MAQYFAIINSTDRVQLFNWDANAFRGNPELHFATDDLTYIRGLLESIQLIQIIDEQDNEVASFNEYDGFSSINYLGRNYSSQLNGFANQLVVTLTKIDLVSQVQRIDAKVNPIIDFEAMTLDQYKEWKINQFSAMGEQLIFAGTNVTLLNGVTKNFTYDLEDQSNLLNAIFIIQALGDLSISIPYHGHGEPCELYNARDVLAVYFTLQFFSTRIQTEVNMKINWVRSCMTKEEAMAINFTDELPAEWAERAEAIMGPAMELATQLQAQYFGDVEPIVEPTEEPIEEDAPVEEGGEE